MRQAYLLFLVRLIVSRTDEELLCYIEGLSLILVVLVVDLPKGYVGLRS